MMHKCLFLVLLWSLSRKEPLVPQSSLKSAGSIVGTNFCEGTSYYRSCSARTFDTAGCRASSFLNSKTIMNRRVTGCPSHGLFYQFQSSTKQWFEHHDHDLIVLVESLFILAHNILLRCLQLLSFSSPYFLSLIISRQWSYYDSIATLIYNDYCWYLTLFMSYHLQ